MDRTNSIKQSEVPRADRLDRDQVKSPIHMFKGGMGSLFPNWRRISLSSECWPITLGHPSSAPVSSPVSPRSPL